MKTLRTVLITLALVVVLGLAVSYGGLFNMAADDHHWGMTAGMIETMRDRNVARQADDMVVPGNLADAKLIANGASEYAEMCTGCHLAPGMKDTEMRKGLYPMPPRLAESGARRPAAEQYWIVKHGLKMTGMPAWGLTHDDERIWSIVAFLQKLPSLSPDQYRELLESGEGHHHHDGTEEHEEGHSHEADEQP
jgi:mono/diheme cytochrome c family protein